MGYTHLTGKLRFHKALLVANFIELAPYDAQLKVKSYLIQQRLLPPCFWMRLSTRPTLFHTCLR